LVGSNNDVNRNVSSPGSLFIGAQHPDIPNSGGDVFRFYNGLLDDMAFYDKAFKRVCPAQLELSKLKRIAV